MRSNLCRFLPEVEDDDEHRPAGWEARGQETGKVRAFKVHGLTIALYTSQLEMLRKTIGDLWEYTRASDTHYVPAGNKAPQHKTLGISSNLKLTWLGSPWLSSVARTFLKSRNLVMETCRSLKLAKDLSQEDVVPTGLGIVLNCIRDGLFYIPLMMGLRP